MPLQYGSSSWHFMLLGAVIWYADILKCNSHNVETLLAAAQYTVSYVKAVEQEASPSKCVLLSTSKSAIKRMTVLRNENAGCFWAAKLDDRDIGGHLDVPQPMSLL